jgi:hypothetical protein
VLIDNPMTASGCEERGWKGHGKDPVLHPVYNAVFFTQTFPGERFT